MMDIEKLIKIMQYRAWYWHRKHYYVLPYSDYESVGNECIAEALHKYDPTKALLKTYISFLCDRRMQDAHRKRFGGKLKKQPLEQPLSSRLLYKCDYDTPILVKQILAQLSPRLRRTVKEHYLEGNSVKELALREGKTRSAIEARIRYARKAVSV